MDFGDSVKLALARYGTIRGRSARAEFWFFILFYVLVVSATAIVDNIFGLTYALGDTDLFGQLPPEAVDTKGVTGFLGSVASLILTLPILTVSIRRLQDTGRAAGWLLLGCIPLVGIIILIVWWCQRGTVGDNRFGPDPLLGKQA